MTAPATPMTPDTPKDGGAAFPRTGEGFGNPKYDAAGMSLRDYFAAKALVPIVTLLGRDVGTADDLARDAYALADSMLLARTKRQP